MVGIWAAYANVFLYVCAAAILIFFGIPLIIAPLRWAQVFRWDVRQGGDLTVMLGRSLGVLLSLVAVFAIRAAAVSQVKPFFFDMLLWLIAGMGILHAYGAIRRQQPKTETLEIILWVVLFILTICFYPQ